MVDGCLLGENISGHGAASNLGLLNIGIHVQNDAAVLFAKFVLQKGDTIGRSFLMGSRFGHTARPLYGNK